MAHVPKLARSPDTLTQRDWLALVRASRSLPTLPDDALKAERDLQLVQAAAAAGWLDCDGLPAGDVGGWPIYVDLQALAEQIADCRLAALTPDPKASAPPPNGQRPKRRRVAKSLSS